MLDVVATEDALRVLSEHVNKADAPAAAVRVFFSGFG